MGLHHQRGLLLYDQSRYDLAEQELRQALSDDPDNAIAHAFLGLCLAKRAEYAEATHEAQMGICLEPDTSFVHYALAKILLERDHVDEAEDAILEAIRLDPDGAGYYAVLAGIHFMQQRWTTTLETAEQGLRVDAENIPCSNLRAMALVKLGRRAEAGAIIEATLAKDPNCACTHAIQGWVLLYQGNHAKAQEHFRETLRLEPELGHTHTSFVEALKARNPIYRLLLGYFRWMSRLSGRARWGFIIGGYLGYRALRTVADQNAELAPWIWPVLIAYMIFAALTWLADPLVNLLLRLDRFGRLALSREQITASNWVGGCLLPVLVALGAWVVTGEFVFGIAAGVCGLTIIPLAGTFECQSGWPRTAMAVYTGLLAAAGLGGAALLGVEEHIASTPMQNLAGRGSLALLGLFLFGAILSSWVAIGLSMLRPKR